MIYKFTVSEKGYGVAVCIDVDEIREPIIIDTDHFVTDNIFLRIDSPIYFLSKEAVDKYIIRIIKELSNSIYNKIDESTVCFHVKSVDTNPIHFQEEGLYCAMRGWLAHNYGLELAPINIELDENNDRFIFNI